MRDNGPGGDAAPQRLYPLRGRGGGAGGRLSGFAEAPTLDALRMRGEGRAQDVVVAVGRLTLARSPRREASPSNCGRAGNGRRGNSCIATSNARRPRRRRRPSNCSSLGTGIHRGRGRSWLAWPQLLQDRRWPRPMTRPLGAGVRRMSAVVVVAIPQMRQIQPLGIVHPDRAKAAIVGSVNWCLKSRIATYSSARLLTLTPAAGRANEIVGSVASMAAAAVDAVGAERVVEQRRGSVGRAPRR